MPTVTGLTAVACFIAVIALAFSVVRRWLVLLVLPVVVYIDWYLWNQLREPSPAHAVADELGWSRTIASFIGWNVPFVMAFALAALRPARYTISDRCARCGAPLGDSSSSACPECGHVPLTSFGRLCERLSPIVGTGALYLVALGWLIPLSISLYLRYKAATFIPKDDFDNWNLVGYELGHLGLLCGAALWFTGTVTVISLRLLLRRRRPLEGHCDHCGYNLTGNTSGRCPECGRPSTEPATNARHEKSP